MKSSQKALITKDLKELIRNKQVFLPMLIVPILLMIIIPSVVVIPTLFTGTNLNALEDMRAIINRLPKEIQMLKPGQLILKISLEYFFPSFFMMIPLMTSSIIGASSFVGEKEHKTMETLLYCPISIKELFFSKLIGVFILSYSITLLASIFFGIIINIGGILHFSQLIFPNVKWLLILFWLSPAVLCFGLIFMVLISARAETFQGAQQMSGFIILPVVLLIVSQFSGLFLLNNLIVFISGAVFFIVDYLLILKVSKGFIPEKLVG